MQMNPRVSSQFTGNGARVLHLMEIETGKHFLFTGSEGLPIDHFEVVMEGGLDEIRDEAIPFRDGDEVLVTIVEPHMYEVDDAVAKIDGYIVSVAGGGAHVGEKRLVRIVEAGRTAASAVLVDNGASPTPAKAPAKPRATGGEAPRDGGEAAGGREEAGGVGAAASAEADEDAPAPRRASRRKKAADPSRRRRTPPPRATPTAPRPGGHGRRRRGARDAAAAHAPQARAGRPRGRGARAAGRRRGGRRRRRRAGGLGRGRCRRIEASAPWPQRRTAPFRCQGGSHPRRLRHPMYAIVKTGGKQYRVEKGQTLLVERLPDEAGATVALEPIMFRSDDAVFDADALTKVRVDAKVVEHVRGEKLRVFKFKPKRGYRKRTGHRQNLTRIEVTDIVGPGGQGGAQKTETTEEATE